MSDFLVVSALTLHVIAQATESAWDRLPLVISALVALVGIYMGWQARQDNQKKDAAKKTLDTLTIGQEWVVGALDRATGENKQLRADFVAQQHEHEEAIKGWQAKVAAQEDEIIALTAANRQCVLNCEDLQRQYDALERSFNELKRKLETP